MFPYKLRLVHIYKVILLWKSRNEYKVISDSYININSYIITHRYIFMESTPHKEEVSIPVMSY